MATISRPHGTVALMLAALVIPHASALAQGAPRFPSFQDASNVGIGYVASIPNTYVGVALLATTPKLLGGAGVYADIKLSVKSPENDPFFRSDITPAEAEITLGDLLFQEKNTYFSVNLALVYALTPQFALYGGAGYTRERHYVEYYDDSQTRGDFGFYWVADEDASSNSVNLLGGVFFRAARYVSFQTGVESQPGGAVVGVMFTYPF